MGGPADFSEDRRGLLLQLLDGGAARHRRSGETVERRAPGADAPLSAEQEHVFLHAALADCPVLYNEAVTLHRTGSFSLKTLERAFNEVLRRHEIWRSSIQMRAGRPRLVAHPDVSLALPLVDLTDLPAADRESAATELATQQARRPFDLASAPLLRGTVVKLAPERCRLYLTLHHIIFDGVSIYRVLMPELTALYAAFEAGADPDLPEPPLQYGDYACWRERRLAQAPFERELDYWRERLEGDRPELALPADRPRAQRPTHRGGMETFELSPELTRRIKSASAEEGATPYVLLLAAFKALLFRSSGQEDILVGGVTDMRRRPELERVMGYFLNCVTLRTRPRGELSFRDYLAEVRQAVVGALDASNVPFDHIIRALRPPRQGARHPLFQVLFSVEPPAPGFPAGWDMTQMDVTVGTAKYDLHLELDERHDRLIGRFLYSADLFEPATIRRMISSWRCILEAATANPGARLIDLPLLTEAERRDVVTRHNDTAAAYPQASLDALVEAQSARTPDRVALECGQTRWSFAELEQRSNALAAALASAGAAPGGLVGVAMDRSCDMVAGLLATLRTGAAYLPLDPGLPAERLAFLIGDAAPAVILADAASALKLPSCAVPVLVADDIRETATPVGWARRGPDDLAYVLHTSGSTGRPKAVAIRHGAVVNLLEAVRATIGFDSSDTLVAVSPLMFDIAALELFLPLVAGGRLVVASRDEATDPALLAALLRRTGCSVMQATPATWRLLIAGGWAGAPRLKALCGGEALPTDLGRALLDRCARLWNLYGPTETTIWSLCHPVSDEDDPAPIGKPLANTRAYVVDAAGEPLPDLAIGELLIAGDGLALGYRGSPDLTAARFVAPAWLGGERAYRTGDRARRRADGVIEFLGRTDNQVKIRGFRVALEEVEAAIGRRPNVAAAARAWPDASGELALAGYVAGDIGPADIPDLRRSLSERLPHYMIPATFDVLPELPMTANGKVDRSRLPRPSAAQTARSRPPAAGLESLLAELWTEALGLTEVGAEDSFFDLGGHSLLAAALMARIEARLAVTLPLAALFEAPTIAELAEVLSGGAKRPFSHLVRLRAGRGRPLFIVHGIFGNVMQLGGLAEALATPRPIFGIQARGADLDCEPHATLDEMVEAYLAAIREVQPAGPYALSGYSFGGLVAFEMCRRLRADGHAVELAALLETDLDERYLPAWDKLSYNLELAGRVLRKIRNMPASAAAPYLASKLRQLGHRALLRIGLRNDFITLEPLEGRLAERNRRMVEIGVRAFRVFRPGPYDGALSLFQIPGPRFGACDPTPIWRRAAKVVELFEIDGEHSRITEQPYVATLAAQLDRRLAWLDGQDPGTDPGSARRREASEPRSGETRLAPALGAGGGTAAS